MDFSQNLRGSNARIGSASFGGGVPLARLRGNGAAPLRGRQRGDQRHRENKQQTNTLHANAVIC